MRLALTVELPGGDSQDVAVKCDVTATVEELARAIVYSAPFDSAELREFARRGLGHLTLLVTDPVQPHVAPPVPVLLDPLAPLTAAGLRSGATVRPVREGEPSAHRSTPVMGHVDVQNGTQAGARYLLVPGPNPIGRDPASRVPLRDRSVSRRHAVITTPDPRDRDTSGTLTLTDLASANGIEASGARVARLAFGVPTTVALGAVSVRITPRALAAVSPGQPPARETSLTRSPRVQPRFPRTTRVLPTPPSPPQAARLPVLALIAPALIGVAMFLVTRSPLSLLMVVLSPMMAVGSWLDGKLRRTRSLRAGGGAFASSLAAEREILSDLHAREQRVRDERAPTGAELAGVAALSDTVLWSRHPANDGFLALRLGTGSLPSRTGVTLPPRGDASAAHWAALEETVAEFQEVPGVPIVADLGRCGSLGVAGTGAAAHGLARSLIAQLVTLHSPTELRLAAIALGQHGSTDTRVTGDRAAEPTGPVPAEPTGPIPATPPTPGARALGPTQPSHPWGWLKWLPHVGSAAGPIVPVEPVAEESATGERAQSGPAAAAPAAAPGALGLSDGGSAAQQLAETEETAAALAAFLEAVLSARAAAPRSTLPAPASAAAGSPAARESLVLLVIDQGLSSPLRARLIGLAARGPAPGLHTIWVAPRLNRVPAACDVYVEFPAASTAANPRPDAKPPTAGFVREGVERPLDSVDTVDESVAVALARTLAPLADAAAGAHSTADLPQRAHLRDLHETDLVGGGAPIARQWRASDSLVRRWREGRTRTPTALAATVGQGLHGPLRIDLGAHGPHALVGGTTGSGKSEFLQTWIMSLAAHLSPDRLTFLLVDYKGGAAFAECVDLPHTVGLVTDLTPHLVRRALASLRAELQRRELLLAAHGAKDLAELERRSDPAAPPLLVIVIDEFAALARDAPEFVAGVVDIAQRGRSLGLHLVMATQRPAGVVSDNLRANTNVRIALRVADRADSRDVLGGDDAALFRVDTPGRAAVKIGSAPIAHFQTGYLGDAAAEPSAAAATEIVVRSLPFGEGAPWPPSAELAGPRSRAGAAPVPRDIERLRDGIRAAAAAEELSPPRRPWLPELPSVVPLRALEREQLPLGSSLAGSPEGPDARDAPAAAAAAGCSVAIGREDMPDAQAQPAARIDLEACGNLAIIGASGAGKTTALVTIACSVASQGHSGNAPGLLHLYGIDASGGHLAAVAALPTCGGVAQLADRELTLRTLRHVHGVVVARRSRLAAAAEAADPSMTTLGGRDEVAEPRLILFIDGLTALTQSLTSGAHGGDPMASSLRPCAAAAPCGCMWCLPAIGRRRSRLNSPQPLARSSCSGSHHRSISQRRGCAVTRSTAHRRGGP